MELSFLDVACFVGFLALVVSVSLYASRKEEDSADYFLAGRGLSWWLIGFSLIASNISTEHFVGMAGAGFGNAGLAIASYEWIAAIALVVVGLFFLPLFLRIGIYTMPEFLEHRYGAGPRALMAVYMLAAYVGIAIAAVLYSGALGLSSVFELPSIFQDMLELEAPAAETAARVTAVWLIGLLAGAYTVYGGLKAVVWSDLLQGAALLLGGAMVTVIGFSHLGGIQSFLHANADKLHVILPATDKDIPWTALLLGIWIPNFFYWGFNQFITQRTLGARSLAQGQRGIMLAAFIKLLIPFIIVFPGIMAFEMFRNEVSRNDLAYPVLIKHLVPVGLRGLLLAALFGAVMSSLDSMLNSASSIFTMDLYKRHVSPDAEPRRLVRIGRIATAILLVIACLIAPLLVHFKGVFDFIQKMWGFISPGIVTVFVFGIVVRRAPGSAALAAMLLGVPVYGVLLRWYPEVAFLNHMAITFGVLVAVMTVITLAAPLPAPVRFPSVSGLDLTPSRSARWAGGVIVALTIGLYVYFW